MHHRIMQPTVRSNLNDQTHSHTVQDHNYRRLRLDPDAILGYVGEKRVIFSPREWQLINYLVAREGTAVSHKNLLSGLFKNSAATKNALAVYALRINRKLRETGCHQQIESVRGFGYRWE